MLGTGYAGPSSSSSRSGGGVGGGGVLQARPGGFNLCSVLSPQAQGHTPLSKVVAAHIPLPTTEASMASGTLGGEARDPGRTDRGLGETVLGQWPRRRPGTQPCSVANPGGADKRLLLERQG